MQIHNQEDRLYKKDVLHAWHSKCAYTAAVLTVIHLPTAGLTSVDISADSTVAITGSEDMTAKISNIHTGKVLGTFVGNSLHCCHHFLCPSKCRECPMHLEGNDRSAAANAKRLHHSMHSYKVQIRTTLHALMYRRL